jgi:hypothetical protein
MGWAVPGTGTIEWSKAMTKRSRPTIVRQVEDKRPQAPLPDDGKSQVISKEPQDLNDKPTAVRICGEDDYFTDLEYRRSRLKEALGIDDYAFCDGLLQQLNSLFPLDEGPKSETDFNFVLSVLKSPKPVDKDHAMLLFQMALVQLCIPRQAQILLKPINYELPYDVAVALHRANWDAGRMEPQKIKIQNQPVRQTGERTFNQLLHTFALQLQISTNYRKSAVAKPQAVFTSTDGAKALPTHGAEAKKTEKDPAERSSRLNGSHRSAAGFTDRRKQMNSINVQKGNGQASS